MEFYWIEPHVLAVSRAPQQANEIRALHQGGIRAILTLSLQPVTATPEITPKLLNDLDIQMLHVPIPDNQPPTSEQANNILLFLAEMHGQDRPVLIHCEAGVSRTGTVLHLYYIAQGMTYEAARAQVLKRRPSNVIINDRQAAFLRAYAQQRAPETHE
jgi:atypical dual specificity phosphatase